MQLYCESNFGYLIGRSHFLLVSLLNRNFHQAGLDLTKDQFLVLKLLWSVKEAVNQQFISEQIGKDKYNITKLIDGLEKRGFVKRVADQKDRRMKYIHLTDEGWKIQPTVESVVEASFETLLSGIHDADLEVTAKVLTAFIDNLKNEKP